MVLFSNIVEIIVGRDSDFQLEQRIFNAVCLLSGLLGIYSIINNIVLQLSPIIIAVNTIEVIITLVLYGIARTKCSYKYLKSILLYSLLTGLSIIWMTTGGLLGSTPYVFIISFAIFIIITWGVLRVVSIISHLLVITFLISIQILFPHWLTTYPDEATQYIDTVVTLSLALASIGIINYLVVTNYFREKIKAEEAHAKADGLLLNILPREIASQLKDPVEDIIADQYGDATVFFADLVGFTELSSRTPAREVVDFLNRIFTEFDGLVEQYGLEKIKTIGDAYMVVGGIPQPMENHTHRTASFALDILERLKEISAESSEPVECRIGIHCGPLIAGVIGKKKFIYDVWGDTVNVASRLESHGKSNMIQVSREVYERLKDDYEFHPPQIIMIHGKGQTETYFLKGRKGKR